MRFKILLFCLTTVLLEAAGPSIFVAAKGTPEHPRNSDGDLIELADGSWFHVWCQWTSGAVLSESLDKRLALRPGGATAHDLSPCQLFFSISRDEGRSWSAPRVLIRNEPGDLNVMPASLLRLADGEVMLQYHRMHSGSSTSGFVQFSRDNATTWSPPVRVWGPSENEHIFAANGVLRRLSTGRIVLPVCYPKGEIFGNDPQKPRFATTFWSDDRGRSWRRSSSVLELPMRGAMEPTVAEKPSGGLLMVLRTQLGSIFVSESDDGIRWSPPQTSGMITSESRSCIHRIPGTSEMVLLWNPAAYQPALHHLGLRTPLAAAISFDNGKSWSRRKEIESDPNYEYTNMSMDFTSKGQMIVHYMASRMLPGGQFGRSAIDARVAVVPLEWLRRP